MHLSELDEADRNTILAALRFYQMFLETGTIATGPRLQMILELGEAGGHAVTTDRIDELCELVNTA